MQQKTRRKRIKMKCWKPCLQKQEKSHIKKKQKKTEIQKLWSPQKGLTPHASPSARTLLNGQL
jgi:hypothetical protein